MEIIFYSRRILAYEHLEPIVRRLLGSAEKIIKPLGTCSSRSYVFGYYAYFVPVESVFIFNDEYYSYAMR